MGRIIVTVALVVVFAVLVALNIGFTTSVNLFGNRLDNVPVVSVAALSFAVGVICSLFIYIGRSLHHRQKRGLADRDRDLAEREKTLAHRQAGAKRAPKSPPAPDAPRESGGREVVDEPDNPAGGGRKVLAKILDFFRSPS
ncbi:MAG: LapA family protein [Spirochaetes bacterium]|nr:LapA family protein [Spirochaetota bacterium]